MGKPCFYFFNHGQKKKLKTKQTKHVKTKVQHMKEHNENGKHQQDIDTYDGYVASDIYCRDCKSVIKQSTIVKTVTNSKSVNIEKFKKISFLLDSHLYHLHCAIRLNIVELEDIPDRLLPFVPYSYEVYGLPVPEEYFELKEKKKIATLDDYIYRFNGKKKVTMLCPIPQ